MNATAISFRLTVLTTKQASNIFKKQSILLLFQHKYPFTLSTKPLNPFIVDILDLCRTSILQKTQRFFYIYQSATIFCRVQSLLSSVHDKKFISSQPLLEKSMKNIALAERF